MSSPYTPYSDHSILCVKERAHNGLKVCNLNVAQPGKLTTYGTCQKVVCSSSLRTVTLLSLLHDKKAEIDALLCDRMSEVMTDSKLSVQEKNDKIKTIADEAYEDLVKLGFDDIKPAVYWPARSFNPGANPADMKRNPDLYIKAPVFILEDDDLFKNRMKRAYEAALKNDADIYTFQEVELGNSFYDNIVYVNIGTPTLVFGDTSSLTIETEDYDIDMADYPKVEDVTSSCVMTVVNKKRMSVVDDDRTESIYSIFKELFNVTDNSKLRVTPVQNKLTQQTRFVVNAHVGYWDANKSSETYLILRKILDNFPEIIFAGDLNLQVSKQEWINHAFGGNDQWKGTHDIIATPEIVLGNKANPTFDVVFIGKQVYTTKEQLDAFLACMKDGDIKK